MRVSILAAAVAAVLAAPASAAVVDFTNIRAEWYGATTVGGNNIQYYANGTDHAYVRWGTSTGEGRSGYDFQALSIPQLTVSPPGGSDVTSIATFRHVNNPITGTSISSINLKFTTDVTVDGNFFEGITFVYNFSHVETDNNQRPCPYGDADVNRNGCADRVQVNFNSQSEFFTINGYDYALDVFGFLVNGNPATSFLTVENKTNEAQLRGRLVLYSEAVDGVPEPATWAMFIAGFGLVGAAARRRQSTISRVAS